MRQRGSNNSQMGTSTAIIKSSTKSLKLIQDYNDMTVGLAMLNAKKDVNTKESAA